MAAEVVPLLADRREEIKAIHKLYLELSKTLGEEAASHVLCEAIAAEARAAGARAAPDELGRSGFEDFAAAIGRRDGGQGTGEWTHSVSDGKLFLNVSRCDLYSLYASSVLPGNIAVALSCGREAPFAKGYDPRLSLLELNSPTKASRACSMVFGWNPDALGQRLDKGVGLSVRDS